MCRASLRKRIFIMDIKALNTETLSITIEREHCTGCMRCVRICPTEALRVRNNVVQLNEDRCINCGRCIEACTEDAIHENTTSVSVIYGYPYTVAVIPASYPVQFPEAIDYAASKKALYQIGFDYIAEEAMLADLKTSLIVDYVQNNPDIRPVISGNPAVLRLMQARFPSLLRNIANIDHPLNMIGGHYRDLVCREKGCPPEDVGVFLIASCVSQISEVRRPDGLYPNLRDGAISFREIYRAVRGRTEDLLADRREVDLYPAGLSLALADLEAEKAGEKGLKTLAVTGVGNVLDVLSRIENQQLEGYDYIVLHCGIGGQVGDSLNVENPCIAGGKVRNLVRKECGPGFDTEDLLRRSGNPGFAIKPLQPKQVMQLDGNIAKALEKIRKIQEIRNRLPGLDCAACGAPNCFALAEDIFFGKAELKDCVIHVKRLYDGVQRH